MENKRNEEVRGIVKKRIATINISGEAGCLYMDIATDLARRGLEVVEIINEQNDKYQVTNATLELYEVRRNIY